MLTQKILYPCMPLHYHKRCPHNQILEYQTFEACNIRKWCVMKQLIVPNIQNLMCSSTKYLLLRVPDDWRFITINYNAVLRTTRYFITGVVVVNKTTNLDRFSSWWQIIWWKIFNCVRIHLLSMFVFSVDCKRVIEFRNCKGKWKITIFVHIKMLKHVKCLHKVTIPRLFRVSWQDRES